MNASHTALILLLSTPEEAKFWLLWAEKTDDFSLSQRQLEALASQRTLTFLIRADASIELPESAQV